MSVELLYTSAPKGLRQGSRGFCTVLSTAGTPINLATRLESLSGYRHLFATDSPEADSNPIALSHLKFALAGQPTSVISRVSAFGADYSGRTNKIAHHVVVDRDEFPAAGPAWLLQQPGLMRNDWDGTCSTPATGPAIPQADQTGGMCNAWNRITGDAGWGGVVAEAFSKRGGKPTWITYTIDQQDQLLGLLDEAIALLSPDHRWDATFSTYAAQLPPDIDCRVRCVVEGTEEARFAAARGQVMQLVPKPFAGPVTTFVNVARGKPTSVPLKDTANRSVKDAVPSLARRQLPLIPGAGRILPESPPLPPALNGIMPAPPLVAPAMPRRKHRHSITLVATSAVILGLAVVAAWPRGDSKRSYVSENVENKQGQITSKQQAHKNAPQAGPDPDKPQVDTPELDKPGPDKPEPAKPEQNKPEQNKPEQNKPEQNKPEPDKPEQNKPEQDKPEQDKPEQDKPEQDKPEPDKSEPDKTEPDKTEPDKTEREEVEPGKPMPASTIDHFAEIKPGIADLESVLKGVPSIILVVDDSRIKEIDVRTAKWCVTGTDECSVKQLKSVSSVDWLNERAITYSNSDLYAVDPDATAYTLSPIASLGESRLYIRVQVKKSSNTPITEDAEELEEKRKKVTGGIVKARRESPNDSVIDDMRKAWHAKRLSVLERVKGLRERVTVQSEKALDLRSRAKSLPKDRSDERQKLNSDANKLDRLVRPIRDPLNDLLRKIDDVCAKTYPINTRRELQFQKANENAPLVTVVVDFKVRVSDDLK